MYDSRTLPKPIVVNGDLSVPLRIAIVVLALVSCGCASSQKFALRALGSPDRGGLAVIRPVLDADFKDDATFEAVRRHLMLGRDRLPQASWLVANIQRADGHRIRGGDLLDGLIVFGDLEPGKYVLHSVEHSRQVIEHVEDLDIVCELTKFELNAHGRSISFEVRPGRTTYVGSLELQAHYEARMLEHNERVMNFRMVDYSARLRRDPDDELRAWNALLARSPASAWAPVMTDRVRELEGAPTISKP